MNAHRPVAQRGYALLIMLLLLMGAGGVVLAGFTQDARKQVEKEKFLHNKRVLEEAKQALLQFAYNYPETNQLGPGHLPCPDTDNNGQPDTPFNCADTVGRLPWNQPNMNLYDIRDADNQRLWYAVSENFVTQAPCCIDNDTSGTLTVRDQSGNIVYDGANPGFLPRYGIAAVIIAPGAPTERNGINQDRTVANGDDPFDTTPDTAAGIIDPINYLDSFFGIEDNATLIQDGANGFIPGPIDDMAADSIRVNDQIIVITAEEVLDMAEKAVLQAYRNALQDYSDRISTDVTPPTAPWTRYYPWLYNYNVSDLGDFPVDAAGFGSELATYLTNFGRVPVIFGKSIFSEDDSAAFQSEFYVDFDLTNPTGLPGVGYNRTIPSAQTGNMVFNDAAQYQFTALVTLPQTIQFVDIADVVGQDGRLQISGSGNVADRVQIERWFWREQPLGDPTWNLCPNGGDELSDCHRDSAGNPTPGSPSNEDSAQILRVIAELDLSASADFDMDYSTPVTPIVASAPSAAGHAVIEATYQSADMISIPVTLSYEYDDDFNTTINMQEFGVLATNDLTLSNVTFGVRYYPALPRWVFDNGWHRSVQMAYADAYRPDAVLPLGDCAVGTCLEIVSDFPGVSDNKKALLVIGGENDWTDGDAAPQPFDAADTLFNDELDDVFNPENADLDRTFDVRTVNDPFALGDGQLDKALVVDEL